MQARILQSVSSQDVVHGGLPNPFLSKSRLHLVQERNPPAVCSMSRKGPQTLKFCSELRRKDAREGELAESSPVLSASEAEAEPAARLSGNSEQHTYSSTGTAALPPVVYRQINFTDRHLLFLGFIACATTGALSCILLAAIPTLVALKKAADSLKKLADTAREELPGTMAAVRLSGMEISDLTMELSDLGQEISEGVRSSTRAVRAAEDGLRRMGTFTSIAMLQERATEQVQVVKPKVALAARTTREALVRARSLLRRVITLTRVSTWLAQRWRMIRPWQQNSISKVP